MHQFTKNLKWNLSVYFIGSFFLICLDYTFRDFFLKGLKYHSKMAKGMMKSI